MEIFDNFKFYNEINIFLIWKINNVLVEEMVGNYG